MYQDFLYLEIDFTYLGLMKILPYKKEDGGVLFILELDYSIKQICFFFDMNIKSQSIWLLIFFFYLA